MAIWYDLNFTYGSLLTSTKMSQLDGNLDALAEGASGAPTITTTAIGSGTISSYNIGDGAVTATEIKSAVITGQHIVNSVATITTTIADNASLVFSAGLFAVYTATGSESPPYHTMDHQYLNVNHPSANWQTVTYDDNIWVMVWSDGSNFRVENNNGTPRAVLYKKL